MNTIILPQSNLLYLGLLAFHKQALMSFRSFVEVVVVVLSLVIILF